MNREGARRESSYVGDVIRTLRALEPLTTPDAVELARLVGEPPPVDKGRQPVAPADSSPSLRRAHGVPSGATMAHTPPPVAPVVSAPGPTGRSHQRKGRLGMVPDARLVGVASGLALLAVWLGAPPAAVIGAVLAAVIAVGAFRRYRGRTSRPPRSVLLSRADTSERQSVSISREGLDVSDDPYRAPPWTPLIESNRLRALAGASLAITREGDIDVEAVVNEAARQQVTLPLTRRTERTTARHVVLLVDESPALDGVRHDIEDLEQAIRGVVGHGLNVIRFDGDPLLVRPPRKRGSRRRPTERGPVDLRSALPTSALAALVISDLGIGIGRRGALPTDPARWLELDEILAERAISRRYLTPYGPSRWPSELIDSLAIIAWSDDLSVRDMVRTVDR